MIEIEHHKNYSINLDKFAKPNSMPCVICGKGCVDPKHFVRLFWGATVVTFDEAEHILATEGHGGDLLYYPVGSDCLKKHPELRPYVEDAKAANERVTLALDSNSRTIAVTPELAPETLEAHKAVMAAFEQATPPPSAETPALKFEDLNAKQQACIRMIATSTARENYGSRQLVGVAAGDGRGDTFVGATAAALVKRGWLQIRLESFGKLTFYLLTPAGKAAYEATPPAPSKYVGSLRHNIDWSLNGVPVDDSELFPDIAATPPAEPAWLRSQSFAEYEAKTHESADNLGYGTPSAAPEQAALEINGVTLTEAQIVPTVANIAQQIVDAHNTPEPAADALADAHAQTNAMWHSLTLKMRDNERLTAERDTLRAALETAVKALGNLFDAAATYANNLDNPKSRQWFDENMNAAMPIILKENERRWNEYTARAGKAVGDGR